MKRLLMVLCFVMLCLTTAGVASANLVVNGTFQDITYSWDGKMVIIPSWNGWTITAAEHGSYYGIGGYAPAPSTYQVFFAGPGPDSDSIGQSITTIPDKFYTFSFWLAQPQKLNSNYSAGDFEAYWNGSSVLSITDTRDFGWTLFSYTVKATGASSTLGFSGKANTSWDDRRGFFFTGVSVTPTPIPGSLGLLASALFSCVGWRRLRKS